MCGISGVVSLEGPLPPEIRRAVPAMTRALRHRGPDGEAFFADDHAALGHCRLAIIDRSGGRQPMSNEDGSCWTVFNGEIYNHRALRQDLVARGHRFRTASDTEAIIHAYEQFGPACLDRLEGMFAFGIYDRRRRRLFLARDRVGKKPLFYGVFGGVLHFASEIKALAASPAWNDEVDRSSLEGYLSLGYIGAPATIYRHVSKLEPGHWLLAEDGRLRTRQYWDLTRFDDDGRSEPQLVDDLRTRLRGAVHDRLESEVPLGAFLSGGIDSGLVVSFMAEAGGAAVVTASVGFGATGHNELEAASLTARHCATRHHPQLIEPRLDDVLDRIVGAFDEPFADSSAVPTYYVSEAARQHVTVALSGDGGDEVFGGYGFRYVPHALECRARALLPGRWARRAVRALGSYWPRSRRLPRPLRLATFIHNVGSDPADAYFSDLCFLKPAVTRRLLGLAPPRSVRDSPVYEAVTQPYRRCPSASPVQRAQYADLKGYLPNDVLVKVDRMSMLHGLEVRCPLLDRLVVEAAFRIPTARKLPRLVSKHLLRRMADTRLPAALFSLPKHGFTAPVGDWIAGPYAGAFLADVFGPGAWIRSELDRPLLQRWFEDHRAGRADHSYALWAVWMLERWNRVRRRPVAPDTRLVQVTLR